MYFCSLPKSYYCHNGSVKKTWLENPIKKPQSKWSSPNQLVQNDTLVKLEVGAKKTIWGFFLPKFLVKKAMISRNGVIYN